MEKNGEMETDGKEVGKGETKKARWKGNRQGGMQITEVESKYARRKEIGKVER